MLFEKDHRCSHLKERDLAIHSLKKFTSSIFKFRKIAEYFVLVGLFVKKKIGEIGAPAEF